MLALNMGTARGALSKTAVQLCEHLPDYPWHRDWQQWFWLLVSTSPTAAEAAPGAQSYRHCSNTGPCSRKHLQHSQHSTPCLPNAPSGNLLAAAQLVCFTQAQAVQTTLLPMVQHVTWQQCSQAQPPAGLLTLPSLLPEKHGSGSTSYSTASHSKANKASFFIALVL